MFVQNNNNSQNSNKSIDISQEQFNEKLVEAMERIVKDNFDRMKGYKNNMKLLDNGIFYSNDYYEALKSKGQSKRIEWLKDKSRNAFYQGYTASKKFTFENKQDSPTNKLPLGYVSNSGEKPSECLEELIKGVTFLACTETIHLASYIALKELLGDEGFDKLLEKTRLRISNQDPQNPFTSKWSYEKPMDLQQIKKGEVLFISGHPYYQAKHINGEAVGFNVVCCDEKGPKFLGLGLNPEGVTLEEIREVLKNEFNKPPLGIEIFDNGLGKKILSSCNSQFLEISEKLKEFKISSKQINENSKIEVIISISIEKILKEFI